MEDVFTYLFELHIVQNDAYCNILPAVASDKQLIWIPNHILCERLKKSTFSGHPKSCINVPSPWHSNLWLVEILSVKYFPLFFVIFFKCVFVYIKILVCCSPIFRRILYNEELIFSLNLSYWHIKWFVAFAFCRS